MASFQTQVFKSEYERFEVLALYIARDFFSSFATRNKLDFMLKFELSSLHLNMMFLAQKSLFRLFSTQQETCKELLKEIVGVNK